MTNWRDYLQLRFYGVCTYLGEKLDMPSSKIRLFFIYASFVAAGSPIIVYLSMAFVLKLRNYIKGQRNPVWDI